MSWEHVLLDKKDHVATITLNRPDKLNAFGGRMRQEIEEVVNDVCADTEVRAIVITGAGKAFCAGGDVNEFVSGTTQARSEGSSSERPVMSREKARFGQVFTRRGLHPDWGGIYFLPRLVGYAKAAELIFSGEVVDAQEAFAVGMVNKVVPHDDLMPTTFELAGRIAKNAPIPVAFAKRGLQNFYRWDLAMALDYEAQVLGLVWQSEDMKEGFKAFLEKREPVFKGR
jgi:2-(1,2-epoxy-1,2-dihydrophenyl)acetyl-CoA isomerase